MTKNYDSVISHLQKRITLFNKRGRVSSTNQSSRLFSAFLVFSALFSFTLASAQIGVTVTNATSTTPNLQPTYTSLNSALTDLNAITAMTGPVTLTLSGNTSETAPSAAGFILGSATLNPLLSGANAITIVKGAGGDVILNAAAGGTATPTSAIPDGIFSIRGADYVTIDGLTFTDSNTANPATMEFGLGLFKASATDGSSNNLIKNCIFNMQRINNAASTAPMVEGSVAILVINATATAAVTAITPTAASGTNSFNMIHSNTINGGNHGIALIGFAAATPFTLGDSSNDIGGFSEVTGNNIFDFGGGAATSAAAGIRANNQWDLNISYNSIDNNTGSGINHATTLRGIFAQAGTSASVTISYNSVTVRSGATTSALTAIDNGIGSTAANNIVNINNNVIGFSYTTATSGIFTAIANTSTAAAVNIDSNTIQQVPNTAYPTTGTIPVIAGGSPNGTLSITNNIISDFVMTGASGTLRGITANTPVGSYTCTGNTITNLSYTNVTSTGSITGIYNLSSATQEIWNNNIISNFSTPTTGTLNGIQNNTVAGTFQCRNNQIFNFSTSTGGVGGFSANGITWSNATVDIRGNYIYSIRSTGTTGGTGGTIFGITHSGAATVSKNTIYDLSSNSTNPTIVGINVNATGTNTISNNLIGDLRAPNATGNNAVNGIVVASGTTNNIYHNTVNIAATSTSTTTFGTSGIYFSSATPVNNLRNNIFVNTSTPGPTGGFTAAIRYTSAPTATNFPTGNNNNLYFAGTPSATNLIYGETNTATATNPQQTLAAYKAYISSTPAVSTRESISITENPLFVSTTGSNPVTDFLKYPTTSGLQLEQGGGIGTGIADDFSGTVRCPGAGCPGGASTPDIGAWELSGIPLDLSSPVIIYTPILTVCDPATSVTLNATITDASGVPTSGAGLPVVYWRVNAGPYTATQGVFVSGSTYSFTFGGTTTASNDVVSYYIAAQDNATTPNVGISPGFGASGFTATPPTAATPPTTPSSYTVSTLAGTYTVGAGQTYPTLTAAIASYNSSCLGGAVTFNLMDTTYGTGETFPIIINSNPQASAINTLTIKPNTTATISGSVASGALLRLNGADFITINGSNSGGTDKSLTITNTSTTAPTAISIASLGAGLGASNNVVRNCNVSTASVTSGTTYGISIGGTTPGTSGADNDTVLIQNNAISVSTVGIYANGTASVSAGGLDNLIIAGNSVVSTNTSSSPIGIQAGNALNSSISSNILSIETNASTQPVGISLETGFVSSTVTLNSTVKILTTSTGGYGGRGITIGTGSATSNVTIANNVINGVNGSNWNNFSNSSSMGIGIGVIGGSGTLTTVTGGVNIYHNTVNMTGSMGAGSGTAITTALFVGIGSTALDIRNNIFVNTQVATNATQKNYSIYSLAVNTAFTNLNYNDYFVTNTFNTASAQLGFIGSDRTDLTALVAGFGQNANSVAINPSFVSPTNLLPTALALDNLGTPVAGITTDFLGVTRSATTPDMGAYEGSFGSGPIFTNTTLPNSCTPGTRTLTATITSLSGMPTTGISLPVLYWRINSGAYQASTGASIGGDQYTFNLGTGSVQGDVISYYIVAQDNTGILASFPNGGLGLTSNPPAAATAPTPVSYANSVTLSGVYTVGVTGNYPTLTAAVTAYNGACLNGAVTFSLIDTAYPSETYPIAINDNVQASAVNTLTIKPAVGVVTTLTGSSANSIIRLNGADYVTIDGSNAVGGTTKDLTLINTNAGTSSFVVWNASVSSTNSASNNTFKNLNVIGNAPLTTFGGIFSGSGTTAGGAAETPNNNVIIENNAVSKVQIGIAVAGNTAGNTGNIIRQNTIGSTVVGDRVGFKGIFVSNNNGLLVSKNTIFDIITTALNPFGIDVAANVTNSTVDSNVIRGIQYTGINGYAGKGIVVNTGVAASNLTISNNVISEIKGDSWSSLASTDIIVGLRITGTTGGVNVYHNSINLGHGTFAGNTNGTFSTAFHIGSAVTALDVRNNIFATNLVNSVAAAAKSYAIASEAPSTAFTNINNNDYYVSGSQGVLGFIALADRTNLAAIQTGFGQNGASVNVVPNFVSASDLHLVATTNAALSNLGTFIPTVTLDIDGETRSTTTPDMGADEFCNATTNTTTITACGTYLWNVNGTTYTTSGTYTNVVGCATEILNLTVNPNPSTATSQIDNTLTATETGATYQWVTCGAGGVFTPIAGATLQSYEVTAVGSYAVEITKNGCFVRSACIDVTTLSGASFDLNNFNYYPNPVISSITFKYDKEIESITVYDLNGRLLKQVTPNSLEVAVDLSDLASAMYIAKVTAAGKQTEIKLLKK